jgi:UDP-N-acetyl-D-mannosaminuronate dehydrogenase
MSPGISGMEPFMGKLSASKDHVSSTVHAGLAAKIRDHTALLGIIGLGYVGLPLARTFSVKGFPVLGLDIDPTKIEKLKRGESYIGHIPAAIIKEMCGQRFDATTDFKRLSEPDVIIICVPTPLTEAREPDLKYIVNSAQAIAAALRPGQLVILESTTYPTTTRNVMLPILEAGGLKGGQDFFVAFSPEREDPGNVDFSTSTIPKVVGGLEPHSLELAGELYSQAVVKVVRVSSPEVAEACKILENTYRAINIALVNELKVLYDRMGIDVWEVIDAAKTKPFGFQAFYPGPGLGGHCLAGNEFVTVRDAAGVHIRRLVDLFDGLLKVPTALPDGVAELRPAGLDALCVDQATGRAEFRPVMNLFRRDSGNALLRIAFRGNRTLTVTDGHPMLIRDGGRIVERRADELQVGDAAVLMTSWPEPERWNGAVDLLEMAARRGLDGVRVMPRQGCWSDHDAAIRLACRARGHLAKDVYRHNTLPLSVYLDLERERRSPFARPDLLLSTGKDATWNQVPAVFEIDEAFARLVGYYLSEGCITRGGAWRVRFSFGAHESELVEDTTDVLSRFGFRHSVHRLRGCETIHIKVSSLLLGTLLKEEWGCGVRSEDAQAPARLMAGPRKVREALLAGMIRGDGDVCVTDGPRPYRKNERAYIHQFNSATVGYFSSSPVLLQQAMILLQGLGMVPTFKKGKPHIRVSGRQVRAMEPMLVGARREALGRYAARGVRKGRPRSYAFHGLYATVPVASVERVDPGMVYSMEVADHHTFVTTGGLAVHNCIPIDPFYLTWVARQYGMATRFIELAGEVNTSMPAYVVSRIGDALNECSKPVKGSKVAILGMAYKKNVDDPRESPGFELMELLIKKGAQVSYNDPHIPELPRMRHHPNLRMKSQPLTAEYLAAQDCVLIATDHSAYDCGWIVEHAKLVVDTRNATKGVERGREKIIKA